MALRSIENCRPKRFLHSKFSIEPLKRQQIDDALNIENNKFIDDLFPDQPKIVEEVISHSKLGASSITIFKRNNNVRPIKNKVEDKENIAVKRESRRACVAKTNEKIQNISAYFDAETSRKKNKSVYDLDDGDDDDEMSDNEINFLVQRGNKKRSQAKNRTQKPSRKKQTEMDRIREIEEREIREAAREYEEIKNYKLIVETVQNDDY